MKQINGLKISKVIIDNYKETENIHNGIKQMNTKIEHFNSLLRNINHCLEKKKKNPFTSIKIQLESNIYDLLLDIKTTTEAINLLITAYNDRVANFDDFKKKTIV